jgi:hypothetical protein
VRAFDIGDDPAIRSVHYDEIQSNGAIAVAESDGDVSLVVLLAKNGGGDGAEFPGRTLNEEIIGKSLRRSPVGLQPGIEEPARRVGIVRQTTGKTGRSCP